MMVYECWREIRPGATQADQPEDLSQCCESSLCYSEKGRRRDWLRNCRFLISGRGATKPNEPCERSSADATHAILQGSAGRSYWTGFLPCAIMSWPARAPAFDGPPPVLWSL